MTAPVLAIDGLTVALPAGSDRPFAVEALSLDVPPGETVCLVGESASGKSVTALAVMGLLPEDRLRTVAGSVRLAGEELLGAPAKHLRRLRGEQMAMVFQEPMTALNPVLSCGRQIDEVLRAHTALDARARRYRTETMLRRVRLTEPERMLASYPHQLSGGQRQRILLAIALILGPKLLIADEPTTALDVTTQAEMLSLLRDLQAESGMGMLFITHDFGVVADLADRVVVMRAGRVVEAGTARQVLARPQHAYTRALMAAVPTLEAPPARAPRARPVLGVRGLAKAYRGSSWLGGGRRVNAVTRVDVDVAAGEIVGLVGESGSGKSTAARCIARLLDPSAGTIMLGGTSLEMLSPRALRPHRRRVQMVFQDPNRSLNPRLTVGASLVEGPRNLGQSHADAMAEAKRVLELVDVPPTAVDRYPHEFSGGQRQRICIARALVVRPELLVADEPVSALDVSVQAQVLGLLARVRDELDLAVLFITHDLRVAAQLCDRVLIMRAGEIVEAGPTAAVFTTPRHAYTQSLLASVPGSKWSPGLATA